MILNNLLGAKSASSNCDQDASFALLNNVHDLILEHNNCVNTETVSPQTDLFADVICDPEFTQQELNFFETGSLTHVSNVICSKVVQRSYCKSCHCNLQTDSDPNELTNVGKGENVSGLKYPSPQFINFFTNIYEYSYQIIPTFASEKPIKKF